MRPTVELLGGASVAILRLLMAIPLWRRLLLINACCGREVSAVDNKNMWSIDLPSPRLLQPRHMGRSPVQRHFLRLAGLSGKIHGEFTAGVQPTDTRDMPERCAVLGSMSHLRQEAYLCLLALVSYPSPARQKNANLEYPDVVSGISG